MKPILVIMAAGMGTRYGGLKQLDSIGPCGELIIDYSIYDAKKAGFEKVIFIIKKSIEKEFKRAIGDRIGKYVEVEYVYQELDNIPSGIKIPEGRNKPWGTAHAIYTAIPKINNEPFVVINADDYYGRDAFVKIYNSLVSDPGKMAMVGYKLENTVTINGSVSRGVCEISNDKLIDIVERTKIITTPQGIKYIENDRENLLPNNTVVSMNLWGLNSSFLREVESEIVEYLNKAMIDNPLKCEYYLPFVIGKMINKGAEVKVLSTNAKWFGVTYKDDKKMVVDSIKEMIKKNIYPKKLWN